jgi:peptidyl-prolyl cis-trans isomerase A (cyclophilin A)
MKIHYALISLVGFALLGACSAEKPETTGTGSEGKPEVSVPASTKVRMKTNKGDIVIELDSAKAPITVKNFLGYVGDKHYDGTVFHRVIDGFMIQGGGFALDGGNLVEKETGDGIRNESQNGLRNDKGTIAMARTSDPDSATAQFFINVSDNAMLNFPSNNGYAVFGKVVEGMDVVEKIKAVQTASKALSMRHPATGEVIQSAADDVPVEPVVIESVTVVE